MKKQLIDAFKRAAQFASRDDSRPGICGVRYEDGKLIATDGHRLIVVDLGEKPWPFAFTMPTAVVEALDDKSAVSPTHTNLPHCSGGVGAPHIAEVFPDWTRVLPDQVPNGEPVPSAGMQGLQPVCVFDLTWQPLADVYAAVKATQTWTREEKQRAKVEGVKLGQLGNTFKDATLVLDVEAKCAYVHRTGPVPVRVAVAEGWCADAVAAAEGWWTAAEYTTRPLAVDKTHCIGVNPKYLKAALDNASKPARCQFAGEFKPIRIDRDDGETHIVMPMRL